MYTAFYGLREKPFSLTPNPAFLYLSDSHREALAHLVYGLEQGEGFIVLSGEVGTGKTTLCRSLLERIEDHSEIAILFNPSNNAIELLQSISEEFGLVAERRSRRQLLSALNEFLLDCHGRDHRVVLIVDEAQNLSAETLEQIRLLSNLETASSKLIQIILLGQPELEEKLDSDSLRQLRQRVTVRWSLHPFSARDTAAYVEHRLYVAAGAERKLFTPAALREVHRLTGGIPRLVNVLSDRVLLAGYAEGEHTISARMVGRAAREVPDAARRIGKPRPLALAGLAAAGLGLLVAAGWAWAPGSPGLGELVPNSFAWLRGAEPPAKLAPVALAREGHSGAKSGTAVTVIVELPSAESGLDFSSSALLAVDSDPPELTVAGQVDGVANQLEPLEQVAFLQAVLAEQTPEAAVDAATRAALELHGMVGPEIPVASLAESIDEIRSRGLGVLELVETDFEILRGLNYPALIRLDSPEDGPRVVALVGLADGYADLMGVGNRVPLPVSVDAVESHWDGSAWVVWNPYLDLPDVIAEGARGAGVLWLQEALARLGYLDAHISGVYDVSTLRGVARFQGEHSVEADGVAGPRTQMLIYAALDEFAPPQLEDGDSG